MSERTAYDAVIVGAGAAGLHCAGMAGQLGLKVLLIDHAEKVAEKIRISGGGRCNFTNRETTPAQFVSANPHFCRSALARYTPQDFIDLLARHRIGWHEKHKGQLFCDEGSEAVIAMLLRECHAGRVTRWQPCAVAGLHRCGDAGFELETDRGTVHASQVVIASGGLSIPKIGASDFGYRIARQFGHRIAPTRPALVPLTFDAATWAPFTALAGVSLQVAIETGTGKARARFIEDLLFTHRGLSGPAVLQNSTFWQPGTPLRIDLAPGPLAQRLLDAKRDSRRLLGNELAEMIPRRLAEAWLAATPELAGRAMPDLRDADLRTLAQRVQGWQLSPSGTEGYRKAEVTSGGVDTRELSSQSLESARVPGLHFIGEVVDVTGWLGGYNFQWAWASAAACARSLAPRLPASERGL